MIDVLTAPLRWIAAAVAYEARRRAALPYLDPFDVREATRERGPVIGLEVSWWN